MSSTNLTDEQFQQAMKYCRKIGATHGKNAAEWSSQYFPGGGRDTGRDASERARAALIALENGEVEIPSPLSGEYAGEMTHRDLMARIADALHFPENVLWDAMPDLAGEYEDAYRCAWQTACEEILWATIQAAVQS